MANNKFHMTELGLHFSKTANGVSKLHGDVAQKQFPWKNIGYVTNGVHHYTWVNNSIKTLFNEFFPNWQMEPEILRGVDKIDTNALWDAHFDAKTTLKPENHSIRLRCTLKTCLVHFGCFSLHAKPFGRYAKTALPRGPQITKSKKKCPRKVQFVNPLDLCAQKRYVARPRFMKTSIWLQRVDKTENPTATV